MKKGYIKNIEQETLDNNYFRKVLYTGAHLQLVIMSLDPGEDIGKETHKEHDQFVRIESGSGVAFIDGVETPIHENDAVLIPSGSLHNITNTGDIPMKIYTLYGAPEHKDGITHETKEIAELHHPQEKFDGQTTE